MNVNKLEIEYFGDATSLLESGRYPCASGKKEQIEKLREFSYDLTKETYQEIINLNQKLTELSKMKVELINDFQDLKSLNKLSGSCKNIKV